MPCKGPDAAQMFSPGRALAILEVCASHDRWLVTSEEPGPLVARLTQRTIIDAWLPEL